MKKGLIVGVAFAGGVAGALSPVLAQDDEGGLRHRIRIEQNFSTGSNLGLEVPEEGTTSLATTRLSYGLESTTRTQSFGFVVGGALRFGSVASGNAIDTGFTDPSIGLRYSRENADSILSFDADYRELDISQTGPLFTFLDNDGLIAAPRDFSSLTGSGKRRAYSLNAGLETGRNAPIGFVFSAAANGARYIDQTDANLADYDRTTAGVSTIFRLNPVTQGIIDLNYTQFDADNVLSTDRTTESVQVGFDRAISPRSTFAFRIGRTQVDSTEGGVLTTISGVSGRMAYSTDLPNGTLNAALDVTQTQNGQLSTFRVTRAIDFPLGSLSANIGVSKSNSSSSRVIGGLDWNYQLARSQFSLKLDRGIQFDANDDERFTTSVIGGFRQELSEVANLTVDVSLYQSEAGTLTNAVDRGDLVVGYERELTSDWSFSAGVDYRFRDEDTVGKADSTSVFFGFGRNFDFVN
ncbi:hypothetical protein ACXYMO_06875 [Arenibacterium sp. CAU 1754]